MGPDERKHPQTFVKQFKSFLNKIAAFTSQKQLFNTSIKISLESARPENAI